VSEFKKDKDRERAFERRYGKKSDVYVQYNVTPDLKDGYYTVKFITKKEYLITEYLKDGLTDYITFKYSKDGRDYEHRFNRFIDAEIMLADEIAGEQ